MVLLQPEEKVYYCEMKGSRFLFCDERVKMHLLHLMDELHQMENWRILAFCIMDDCAYFMIETARKYENEGLVRFIKEAVREKLAGAFYEAGLKKSDLFLTAYTLQLRVWPEIMDRCIKIHQIPLESGKSRRLEDYWWSSYLYYARLHDWEMVDRSFLLRYLSADQREAGKRFMQMHKQIDSEVCEI
ncbi:MAG: hypothetical protein LUF30_11850 [Lachnospiraceae bacterium]|nr:hypothetical protein [Lachnospiraceae bacterium]